MSYLINLNFWINRGFNKKKEKKLPLPLNQVQLDHCPWCLKKGHIIYLYFSYRLITYSWMSTSTTSACAVGAIFLVLQLNQSLFLCFILCVYLFLILKV